MATAATLSPTPATHGLPETSNQVSPSQQTIQVPRGPVTAELSFYGAPADGSKPFNYVENPPAGQPKSNVRTEINTVQIEDLRGREGNFTLDHNAFEALANIESSIKPTELTSLTDEQIRSTYYPEVEKLLLSNVPGANRILLFDHTIRRADPAAHRAPVLRVHVDQTPKSAEQRVRHHIPDENEAEALLSRRYRIINVWRPLNAEPVVSYPLAVADSASVRDEDLIGVEHRYPTRTGETAGVRHNPDQQWYYWSGMTGAERLLLKCFDSDDEFGRWGRVPHTAFVDPRTPENAPARESIEVRALVFG